MSARPRILLVNDTSAESNPGCRAASGVITEMLSRRGKVSVKLPLGYRTESFKSVQGVRKRCVVKRGGYFNSCDNDCTKVDVSGWESVAAQEYGGASELNTLLADVDEVFVNAEGSVHHNFPRALSVLALTRQCIALGKPTYVLNSSIMAMDAELLKCSLEGAAMIHSRESLSADYVSTVVPNVEVVVAPDLAFASIESAQILPLPKQREGVLVTQGVLGTPKQLQFLLPELVSRMGTVSYLTIGDKAENEDFLRICRENGVEEISADTQNLAQLLSMLQQYKVVVSGRHHVNIFCMLAGVPFIALPSNTWKIEGTLAELGEDRLPCYAHDEFLKHIQNGAMLGFESLAAPSEAVAECSARVRNLVEGIACGNSHPI